MIFVAFVSSFATYNLAHSQEYDEETYETVKELSKAYEDALVSQGIPTRWSLIARGDNGLWLNCNRGKCIEI